jgi:regulator of replication initiation timing
MDSAIIIAIVGVLAAPVAAVITWVLNRKKHIADIYTAISDSSQTAVETMQMTMNELRQELVAAREKIEELIQENELLRQDLQALKLQNERLMEQIHDMRVSYEQSSQRDNLSNESHTS